MSDLGSALFAYWLLREIILILLNNEIFTKPDIADTLTVYVTALLPVINVHCRNHNGIACIGVGLAITTSGRRQWKTLLTINERGPKIARNSVFDSHLSPVGRLPPTQCDYSQIHM